MDFKVYTNAKVDTVLDRQSVQKPARPERPKTSAMWLVGPLFTTLVMSLLVHDYLYLADHVDGLLGDCRVHHTRVYFPDDAAEDLDKGAGNLVGNVDGQLEIYLRTRLLLTGRLRRRKLEIKSVTRMGNVESCEFVRSAWSL